jgi:NAD-dependent dihydropyrimidine dehydrogenase PreA subunit
MPRSQAVTIVISRDGRGVAGDRAGFEDALADTLRRKTGSELLVVPHLYHLRVSHPAAAALMEAPGDLAVASWLHPRAAFWTLRALGVGGAAASAPNASQARAIRCLNLADFASVADCAEALAPQSAGDYTAALKEIADAASPRWYPLIDYSRCTGCRKCMDFCLFGVYALSGGNVVVSNPDNCKNGCPACARTCPERAIIFPHYFADAAIAGSSPPAVAAELRRAGAETPSRSETSRPAPQGGARAEYAPPDDLDHLINALEKLDE